MDVCSWGICGIVFGQKRYAHFILGLGLIIFEQKKHTLKNMQDIRGVFSSWWMGFTRFHKNLCKYQQPWFHDEKNRPSQILNLDPPIAQKDMPISDQGVMVMVPWGPMVPWSQSLVLRITTFPPCWSLISFGHLRFRSLSLLMRRAGCAGIHWTQAMLLWCTLY